MNSVDHALANALIAGGHSECWLDGARVLRQIPQSLPRLAIGVMHVVVSSNVCAIETAGLHC